MKNIFGKISSFVIGNIFSTGTSPIKGWLYIGVVVAIFVTISSFYFTMKSAQKDALEAAITVKEQAYEVKELKEQIEDQERRLIISNKKIQEILAREAQAEQAKLEVQQLIVENERKLLALENTFNKNGRDIGRIAERKAGLVQNVINRGTERTFRCFEITTGSPLTEEEKKIVEKNPNYSFCD